jgi:hypothetical protein
MADNPTPNFGGQPIGGPPLGQWTPTQPARRSGGWLAIALAAIAALLGAVALVVALTHSTASSGVVSTTTPMSPTYTSEESAAAHKKLCDVYSLAARAVQIDTNNENPALAGVSTVNAAVMLEYTVNSNPAIPSGDRAAALALAEAYSNAQATAPSIPQRDDPSWQSIIKDVNAKDTAMKKVCGSG